MGKNWIALWVVLLAAVSAGATPNVTEGKSPGTKQYTIVFAISDTTETKAMPVDGICSVRVVIAGSDVVQLWAVPTPATAATSGTQVGNDFTASTTAPLTWKAGTTHVKAIATTAAAGGSKMLIDCNPLTSAGGGGVVGSGPLDEMLDYPNPQPGDQWQLTNVDDTTPTCADDNLGTDSDVLYCGWNEAAAGWVPVGLAGGTDNTGNGVFTTDADLNGNALVDGKLGEDLNANQKSIQSPYQINKRHFYVDTLTRLQAAIDACKLDGAISGYGSDTTLQSGCFILVGGGEYTPTSAITLGGTTAAARTVGMTIQGMGGGISGTTKTDSGTVFSSQHTGSVFEVGASDAMTVIGLTINGNADHATSGYHATAGFEFKSTSGMPITSFKTESVTVTNLDGTAFLGNTSTGQWDTSSFVRTNCYNVKKCLHLRHSQSIGIIWGPDSRITEMRSDAGPYIDVEYGSLSIDKGYFGIGTDGHTAIHFAETANYLVFAGGHTQVEFTDNVDTDITGATFIDADDALGSGNPRALAIRDLGVVHTGDGNYLLDWYGRGSVEIEGVKIVDNTNGTTGLILSQIDKYAAHDLTVHFSKNWYSRGDLTTKPDPWFPTLGTGVVGDTTVPIATTLPTPCFPGQIGVDSDAAAGSQNQICASDGLSWSASGTGDITNIGNATVGTACASGSCFAGAGSEDNLAVNGDLKLRLDTDQGTSPGSNAFTIQNGSGSDIFRVGEVSATLPTNGTVAANTFAAGTVTGTTTIGGTLQSGSASTTGTLDIYNFGSGNTGFARFTMATSGTTLYTLPSDDGDAGEQLQTDGSGVLTWEASGSGGGGGVTDGGAISYVTGTSDAFAIGGSTSAAPFYFDPATGAFSIQVAGGYIDVEPDADDGASMVLKEGSNDGTGSVSFKVPDSGLTGDTDTIHTFGADGTLPTSSGALGTDLSSATGVPLLASGVTTVTGTTGTGNFARATSPTFVTPILGTPTSVTLTNGTGLPVSTGITGLGTNVATALGIAVGSAGGPVTFNGAGGTPSSLTLTNATGLPSSGILTEVRSMWFGAAGFSVDGTQCATPAEVTINSGPKLYTTICADNDASTIYGSAQMPDGWDGGTVTFAQVYVQTAANTSALNGDIAAQCRGNGETPSSTWGTEIAIDDAGVTGSNNNDITVSAAVTPAGTCAGGDMLYWRYQLDATGTTTAVATLHTLGFKMEYTSNVGD